MFRDERPAGYPALTGAEWHGRFICDAYMKSPLIVALCFTVFATSASAATTSTERSARQAQLDAACESARDAKLQPLRSGYVEECVRDEGKERAYCERFYADYGAATGNRGPIFYDLPECETAFEYQKSQRSSSR